MFCPAAGPVPGLDGVEIEDGSLRSLADSWALPERVVPQGMSIAAGRYLLARVWSGSAPIVVDLEEGRRLAPDPAAHQAAGRQPLVTVDGSVSCGDGTGQTRRYARDGELLATVPCGYSLIADAAGEQLLGLGSEGRLLTFTPDGEALWEQKAHRSYVDRAWLSPSGRLALSTGQYDGRCHLWSVGGDKLWSLTVPQVGHLDSFSINAVAWDEPRGRMFVADRTEDFGSDGPSLARSGIWSLQHGAILHRFCDPTGRELTILDDLVLRPGHDEIYVRDSPGTWSSQHGSHTMDGINWYGLCSTIDGSAVRSVANPGMHPTFSPDGRWLTGTLGRVDCETGRMALQFTDMAKGPAASGAYAAANEEGVIVINTAARHGADAWFGQSGRMPSPSGTRLLCVDGEELSVFDARTGTLLGRWQLTSLGGGSQVVHLAWWPDERQVALTFKDDPRMALLTIDHAVPAIAELEPALLAVANGESPANSLLGLQDVDVGALQARLATALDAEQVALIMVLEELAHRGDEAAIELITSASEDGLLQDARFRFTAPEWMRASGEVEAFVPEPVAEGF